MHLLLLLKNIQAWEKMQQSKEKTSIFLLMGLIAIVPKLSEKIGIILGIVEIEGSQQSSPIIMLALMAFATFGAISWIIADFFKTADKEHFDEK
mgnify:CR=1 FL=1